MEIKSVIKRVYYKGKVLTKFEDEFGQEFVMTGKLPKVLYASFADAKRVIDGINNRLQGNTFNI